MEELKEILNGIHPEVDYEMDFFRTFIREYLQ